MSSSREKTLINNTAILSVGTICTKVVTFLIIPLFSRWLSVEDYGTFDLLCTYITLLVPFLTLSIGEGIFRFLIDVRSEEEKSKIITSSGILILGTIMIIFLGIIIASVWIDPKIVIPFGVLLIFEIIYTVECYVVRGFCLLKQYAISGILFIMSMCIAVTVLVYGFNMSLTGMIAGYAVGYAISVLYMTFVIKPLECIKRSFFSKVVLKQLLNYSIPLIPNSISWWVVNVSDRILISFYLGAAGNGIYAIANKVPSICTSLFSVFHLSWQENASLSANDSDRNDYYIKIFNMLLPLLSIIACGVLCVNYFMFKFMFDIRYDSAKYHVPILIISVVVSFLAQFIGGIFVALKQSKINGVSTVIGALANVIINFLLIKRIGLFAASISTLTSYCLLLVIRLILLKNSIKLRVDIKSVLSLVLLIVVFVVQYPLLNLRNDTIALMIELSIGIVSCLVFLLLNKNIVKKVIERLCIK